MQVIVQAMPASLTDPWFEASFYGEATPDGSFRFLDSIDGAQGLWLWCPCGFHDPRYRVEGGGRPHAIIVPFANPRNAPSLPPNHGPHSRGNPDHHARWLMSGTSLVDLSCTPSVAVGDPECWHGFITNGMVTP